MDIPKDKPEQKQADATPELSDPEHLRTLTCVFCGEAYPAGTELHSEQILIDHIEICPKHPLAAARIKIDDLVRTLTIVENALKVSNKTINSLREALQEIRITTERITKPYF